MKPPTIGVAISTRNRRELFVNTLAEWIKHTPHEIPIVVVDDNSDEPIVLRSYRAIPFETRNVRVVRHDYRRGVAMTKNRCIAELMDIGVEHLFLVDDDCHPLTDEWWKPYVESPEPHLSWQWPRLQRGNHKWKIVHDDGEHFSIGFPRGVMLYVERQVVDAVGGMDIAYGLHGGEHVEWQQRIHDRGFTRWPFADICGSSDMWWSLDKDQGGTTGSTIDLTERTWLMHAVGKLWGKQQPDFVPYRESVTGVHDYQLGPRLADDYVGTLDHVLMMRPHGAALEFGVGQGHSLERIARRMFAYGFDSFNGLPEKWRDGFDAGMFACRPPDIPNTHLVTGLFDDTVAHFDLDEAGPVGLVHLDADLYSSTRTVLDNLDHTRVFRPGTYVVFDEWHNYPGCEQHEQKAWREFADRTGISWTVIGHGAEQWAVRIR